MDIHDPVDAAPFDAVQRAGLMAHIAEFARRIKLSGTPEELESFRYLERTMREAGYRTELIMHDAYISLPGVCRVEVDGAALPSITHSMSAPTGPAGITAELVELGEGSADAFARTDLRGRIALVDGIAGEAVAARAARAGALGTLHASPTEHLYEMCVSSVWGSPSPRTRGLLPTTAAATISRDDGAALRARCLAGEAVTVTMATEVDTGWRTTPLLVCDLDAPGPEAPFVLLSGHHDIWHYGVMDNGAANATMLEAARVLALSRATWRRSLRVCFWSGHSHGRYAGSAWYADEHFAELDRRCAAHVNVDSTGGIGADVLTESGVVAELRGLARDAVGAETGQAHAGRRVGRFADHSFLGIGIPSMYGSLSQQPPGPATARTALGWWWHTPHDLADKIDPANLARDTRIVVRTLWPLLTAPALPLDYAGHADELIAELGRIEATLDGRFDIAPLLRAAIALRAAAAAGHHADRQLMAAGRHLLPLAYTSGDRFRPDPATAQPPWPALQPLRDLARAAPADTPFYAVEARRCRNLAACAIEAAAACLNGAIPRQG